jgi:hypothetical protein
MLDYRGQFADLIQRSAAALAASSKIIARMQEKQSQSCLSAVPPGSNAEEESPWMENTTGYLQERIKQLEKEVDALVKSLGFRV